MPSDRVSPRDRRITLAQLSRDRLGELTSRFELERRTSKAGRAAKEFTKPVLAAKDVRSGRAAASLGPSRT